MDLKGTSQAGITAVVAARPKKEGAVCLGHGGYTSGWNDFFCYRLFSKQTAADQDFSVDGECS